MEKKRTFVDMENSSSMLKVVLSGGRRVDIPVIEKQTFKNWGKEKILAKQEQVENVYQDPINSKHKVYNKVVNCILSKALSSSCCRTCKGKLLVSCLLVC